MSENNVSYEFIDPRQYEVAKVLEKLNSNLDYLYKRGQNAPISAKNLIPYSDFRLVSNIEYWKPYSVSKIFIKEAKLSCVSYSNVVGVISPLIRYTFEPGKDYSIVVDAISETAEMFNECYLQLEDETLIRINNEQLIKGKSSVSFRVDDFYTNVRLVLGSSDVSIMPGHAFKYNDRVYNTPLMCNTESKGDFSSVGGVYNAMDFDNNKPTEATLHLHTSINFVYRNVDYLKLEQLKPTIDFILNTYIEDVTTEHHMCATNLYMERRKQNIDLITLREEFAKTLMLQKLSTKYPEYKPLYEQGLDFIGYLYLTSPIKGLFPNTVGSSGNEYSLLSSQVIYDIVYNEIATHGDAMRTALNGESYQLQDILNNIVNFIGEHRAEIFKDYVQGAIFTNKEQLNFRYLDTDNKPSTTSIDLILQLMLCEFFVRLGYESEVNATQTYILEANSSLYPNNYILPSCVLAKGGIHTKSSISITPTIYLYKLNSLMRNPLLDKPKRDDLAQLFTTMLEPHDLYKDNFPLNNNVFSYNYVYMSMLNGIMIPGIRDIHFTSIALCEGKNVSVIPEQGDINNSEQLINRSEVVIDDDSITAIVGEEFIKKDYLDGELQKLEHRLEQAELKLTKETITAWVVNSQEWIDQNAIIKEQGAQIEINKDSITNKVWNKDIQDAVSGIATIGNNLIHNSNFMLSGLKYYSTFASFAFNVMNDSSGKTWCHVESPGSVALSQVCTEQLLKGKANLSIDVFGRGEFKIEVFNDKVLVHTMVLTTTLADTRYASTFDVEESFIPTIVWTFTNSDMHFTRTKVCYGGLDIGWSLNPQDITELHEVLVDDVVNLNSYIDGAFKDGVLSDAEREGLAQKLLDFKNEKLQFDSIVDALNSNQGIVNNPLVKAKLAQDQLDLNTAYETLYNYIEGFMQDPTQYDKEVYTSHYNAYILEAKKLQATIQDANSVISRYEATESSKALQEKVNGQIKDTNDTIKNLNDYVDGAFKDDILDKEEKERLKLFSKEIDKNRNDLRTQFEYISTRPELANTPQLTTLTTTWNDFTASVTAYLAQIDFIYNAEDITQDMRYRLNGLYDDYKAKSIKFQEAMTQANNAIDTTRVDKALETALEASKEVDKKVENLNNYVDNAFKDDVLTSVEKSKLKTLLESVEKEQLNFSAEIDYYIKHPSLATTQELQQLKDKKTAWDRTINELKNTINLLLSKTDITDLDREQVKTAQGKYTDSLKDLNVALQDAVLKSSQVTSNNLFTEVNDSLDKLSTAFNKVKDFTDDAFKDGMISYQEFTNLSTLLETLDKEFKQVTRDSNDLITNPLSTNLQERTDCVNALNAFTTAYNDLKETFTTVTADGKVDKDEKASFNTAMTAYKSGYLLLVAKVSTLRAKLVTLEMEKADKVVEDAVNKKIEDVNEVVNGIRDFSDTAFKDGMLSMNEKESYRVLKMSLTKEHLDVKKEVSVLLDSSLTPELVGQDIKTKLNTDASTLENRFNSVKSALDDIISSNALIPSDKTALDTALNNYNTQLALVREDLILCNKLVNDLRSSDRLNNFVDTTFKEIVERVSTAEQKIEPDAITQTVETHSKTLVNKTYLGDNYYNKETIETNYSTKGEVKILQDKIDLKVSQDELVNKVSHISSDIRLKGINFIYQNGEAVTFTSPNQAVGTTVGYEDSVLRYSLPNISFVFSVYSQSIENNLTPTGVVTLRLVVDVIYMDNTEESFTKTFSNLTGAMTRYSLPFTLTKQVKKYKRLYVELNGAFAGSITLYGFKLEHDNLTSWIPSLHDFSMECDFIAEALLNLQAKVSEVLTDGELSSTEREGLLNSSRELDSSISRIEYITLALKFATEIQGTDYYISIVNSTQDLRTSYTNINSIINNICNL